MDNASVFGAEDCRFDPCQDQCFCFFAIDRLSRQNVSLRSCGAMDNASVYGAEDCRFDPCQDQCILFFQRSGRSLG